MKRRFDTFIGVDLGGGRGKRTAVARLSCCDDGVCVEQVGMQSETGSPWYDETLVAYLTGRPEAVVAIDAPLSLPACLRCLEPSCPGTERCSDPAVEWFRSTGAPALVALGERTGRRRIGKPVWTPYTQRPTETWLLVERGVLPPESMGQGMGPITARAQHLQRALRPGFELNRNLLEVYPKATVRLLFPGRAYARYRHDLEVRQRILHELAGLRFAPGTRFGRNTTAENDRCFDAVMSAYTAYLWARDGWELPAAHLELFARDGWIWVPPEPEKETP